MKCGVSQTTSGQLCFLNRAQATASRPAPSSFYLVRNVAHTNIFIIFIFLFYFVNDHAQGDNYYLYYDAYIDMRACVVVLLRKCVWFRGIKLEWQLPLNGVLRNCQTTICSSAVCRGRAKKQCDGLFKLNKLLLSCGNSCRPQPGCSCAVARFLGWILASYLGIKNSSMAK